MTYLVFLEYSLVKSLHVFLYEFYCYNMIEPEPKT